MFKLILFFTILFLNKNIYSQGKKIIIAEFSSKCSKKRIYIDSSFQVYKIAPLNIQCFDVDFEEIVYDTVTREMTISGKTFINNDLFYRGLIGVSIFTGINNNYQFINRVDLGESSKQTNEISSNGWFKIRIKVAPCLKLCFYYPSFYTIEYDIGKIL